MGGQYNAAFTRLERAVDSLTDAERADHELDLESQKLILALAAKSLAITMITLAENGTNHPPHLNKIANAWQRVEQGDARLEHGDYDGAIDMYQQALRRIQGMILPQPGLNPEEGYEGEDSNEYFSPRKKYKDPRSNNGKARGLSR